MDGVALMMPDDEEDSDGDNRWRGGSTTVFDEPWTDEMIDKQFDAFTLDGFKSGAPYNIHNIHVPMA